MAVVVFDHDEEGFKRWLREHPDGYILNCYKTGRVHSALCKSYRSVGPRMTHTRAKACSTSEQQLFKFAKQLGIDATRCELCYRVIRAGGPTSGPSTPAFPSIHERRRREILRTSL
jgi:hypothetical protein